MPLRVTPTRTLCAAMSTPTLAPAPAPIALGGFFAPPPRVGAAVVFDDFDFARSAFIAPPLDSAATASDSLIRVIDEKDDDDDDDRSVASFAAFDAAGKDDFSDARSPNGFAPGGVDFFPPPPFAPAKTRTTRRIVVVVVVDIAEEEEEEDDDDDAVRLGGAPRASRHPTRALARARGAHVPDAIAIDIATADGVLDRAEARVALRRRGPLSTTRRRSGRRGKSGDSSPRTEFCSREHLPPAPLSRIPHAMAAPNTDWWATIQSAAYTAAETTRLLSLRTAKQAEVMYHERQIQLTKESFGKDVFQHMEANNAATVQQMFADAKSAIDGIKATIAKCNEDIEELTKQMAAVGS